MAAGSREQVPGRTWARLVCGRHICGRGAVRMIKVAEQTADSPGRAGPGRFLLGLAQFLEQFSLLGRG